MKLLRSTNAVPARVDGVFRSNFLALLGIGKGIIYKLKKKMEREVNHNVTRLV